MATTMGVKLDEATQERLKGLASRLDRAPHWVIKTALTEYLDREEQRLREWAEDEARWQRFQESGQAVDQERVMEWLDALAAGDRKPCPE